MHHQIGPYQLVRELGRGGMGVVYEARHPELDRPLALKLLPPTADERGIERFGREATALARVNHPHIVRVHQFGRDPRGLYLVTEMVPGRPLDDPAVVSSLDPTRATRLVINLAYAVEALHHAKLLHRDLKPSNVILRPDGSPVLLDFGIVRELDAQTLTRTGETVGTPAYMAPEQAAGERERQGPATDVYGLAAILFALLARRDPFLADTFVNTIHAVLLHEPRWPSRDDASIPLAVEDVLRRAMAKEPGDRYPSAAAFAQALEHALANPVTRRRVPRWALAAGALLGLAGAALALRSPAPEPAAEPPTQTAQRPDDTPAPTDAPPPFDPLTTDDLDALVAWVVAHPDDPRRAALRQRVLTLGLHATPDVRAPVRGGKPFLALIEDDLALVMRIYQPFSQADLIDLEGIPPSPNKIPMPPGWSAVTRASGRTFLLHELGVVEVDRDGSVVLSPFGGARTPWSGAHSSRLIEFDLDLEAGLCALGCQNGDVLVYEWPSLRLRHTFLKHHVNAVTELRLLPGGVLVSAAGFSLDASIQNEDVLSVPRNEVVITDLGTEPEPTIRHTVLTRGRPDHVVAHPDGRRVAVGVHGIYRYLEIDVVSGEERHYVSPDAQPNPTVEGLMGVTEASTNSAPSAAAYSPDGTRLYAYAGGHDASGRVEIRVWDTQTGALLETLHEDLPVQWDMTLSPSGEHLLAIGVSSAGDMRALGDPQRLNLIRSWRVDVPPHPSSD